MVTVCIPCCSFRGIAIGISRVKQRADDVESRESRRTSVEHPQPDALARLGRQRRIFVLIGVTIEDHVIGLNGVHLGSISVVQAILAFGHIEFALNQNVFFVHRLEIGDETTIAPYMPLAM